MFRVTAILIILLLSTGDLAAQKRGISGVIHDLETGEPIPYSTIEVFNDSILVGGTLSDSLGNFNLRLKHPWTHIRVGFIGYKDLLQSESEIKNQKYLSLALVQNVELLEEAVITAQRTITELKIDRKVINLNSDIQNTGVSALEAFDQIAEVDVDMANNKISLRGNDNIQILINGKPSALSGTEILSQIPASSIDRVEIITSPSVKFRASGISGIINIILKKGFGSNLKVFATSGTRRFSIGTTANYSTPKINFNLNASTAHRKETNNQTIERQFDNGFSERIFTPYQLSGGINKIAAGVDVFFKDQHEFSIGINYTDDDHSYINASKFSNPSGQVTNTYLRNNEHRHNINILDANYRLQLKNLLHFLEFDYQINFSKNSYPLADFLDNTLLQEQFLTEDFSIQSIALDYSMPTSEKSRMETGLFYNTQVLESQLSQVTIDSSFKDRFDYDESVKGLYGLYHFFMGTWQIQTGLRFEQFKSTSQIASAFSERSKIFNNLFLSLHFSYHLNEYHTLTLGYSQRIERPNFHHNNAFQLVNPLFDWQYNPNIIPETSHNIDWSFQKIQDKWKLGISGFYRLRNDVILWKASADDFRQIFRYENAGTFHSYGLELNLKHKVNDFWNATLSTNYYLHSINQNIDVTWRKNYSSRIQFKNTFQLHKNLTTDLVYIQILKIQTPFTTTQPRSRFDFSLNGNFAKSRISWGLRIVDIFNKNIIKRQSQTAGLWQQSEWNLQYQTRNFLVNLNYRLFDKKIKSRNEKSRAYNEPLLD